jgi:hypothetical protein
MRPPGIVGQRPRRRIDLKRLNALIARVADVQPTGFRHKTHAGGAIKPARIRAVAAEQRVLQRLRPRLVVDVHLAGLGLGQKEHFAADRDVFAEVRAELGIGAIPVGELSFVWRARAEKLYAVFGAFRDGQQRAVGRDGDRLRIVQLALAVARENRVQAPVVLSVPLKIENLNAMIHGVGDKQVIAVQGHAARLGHQRRHVAALAEDCDRRAVLAEHVNAMVVGVRDDDIAARVDGHRPRTAKIARPRGGSVVAQCELVLAVMAVHLYAVVAGVDDIHAARVRRDRARRIHLVRPRAALPEAAHPLPGGTEDLNAMIARVGDEHPAVRGDSNARRPVELAGLSARRGGSGRLRGRNLLTRRRSEVPEPAAVTRIDAHPVPARLGDVQIATRGECHVRRRQKPVDLPHKCAEPRRPGGHGGGIFPARRGVGGQRLPKSGQDDVRTEANRH